MTAVVMAGGLGSRMRPLTYTIPKPLLPIGERPILEIILSQMRKAGFSRVFITTGYQAELVKSYFGNGSRFGIELEYTQEPEVLGTAGALFLLKGRIDEPFLVMNCDILTCLDLRKFYDSHVESSASMTVGAVSYEVQVPYGVLEIRDGDIKAIAEKPRTSHLIVAGIYVMNPEIFDITRPGKTDIPEVIEILIARGKKVAVCEIKERWIDVGKLSDYERANNEFKLWNDL
ncbi:MAG: sugar phosphate nucleotidyltransferase [Candidatus Eisenbacteria bacterium]|nr:sugar phosphate nucleotidyltransferase [Candidatus Eisenbacteria bacterium]